MEGNIYISGVIGSMFMEDGVELVDIISQVKKQPNATSFNVHINSEGGLVDTGFDIYNYLKSLGLPIKTIGSGIVASIATVIFMAGDERTLRDGTNFMIHLPMGGIDGTADEIESFSKEVKAIEDKLTKFYADIIAIDKEAIRSLLKSETWLDNARAIDLGFATAESLPIAAKAYFKINKNNNSMTQDDKSWIEKKFESILNLIKSPVKNIIVQDAEGREIDFPTVEEGQTIAEGDTATIDGIAAEGAVTMPNGQVVTFEGGAVISIMEPEESSEEPDAENYKEKYEALKAEFDSMTALKVEFENKVVEKDEVISSLKTEIVNFKKEVTSKFDLDTKKDAKKEDAVGLSPAQKALEAIRNKNKNK